ncbi:MAG: phytanoyl-CoA dioxygenase family protein [Ferruginibacter sp.]
MKKAEQKNFRIEETLTDAHIKFFQKNGFLHFKNFLDKKTTAELLHEVANVQLQLLQHDVKKVNGIPLKFGNDIDGSPLIQRLAFTSLYSNKLSAFLKDNRLQSLLPLLEPYSGRIGENEKDGLVVNHYVNTPASKFTQLGWHTDSPRDLFLGSKILPMLNVGLHLDDCSFDNGGLRVIPGTHKQSLFGLFLRKKYYVDTKADKKEVGFDIEAGDLTIHDGRLWHRVQQSPNLGEASRRRVMYIPIVTGAFKPKHSKSSTPFYHKVAQLPLLLQEGKYSLLNFIKKLSFAK